jgi:hypothetical protein
VKTDKRKGKKEVFEYGKKKNTILHGSRTLVVRLIKQKRRLDKVLVQLPEPFCMIARRTAREQLTQGVSRRDGFAVVRRCGGGLDSRTASRRDAE